MGFLLDAVVDRVHFSYQELFSPTFSACPAAIEHDLTGCTFNISADACLPARERKPPMKVIFHPLIKLFDSTVSSVKNDWQKPDVRYGLFQWSVPAFNSSFCSMKRLQHVGVYCYSSCMGHASPSQADNPQHFVSCKSKVSCSRTWLTMTLARAQTCTTQSRV